jgi:hypothetical protein
MRKVQERVTSVATADWWTKQENALHLPHDAQNMSFYQLHYVLHRPKTKRWPIRNKAAKTTCSLQHFQSKYSSHSPHAHYKSSHLDLIDLITLVTLDKHRNNNSRFLLFTSSLSPSLLAQPVIHTYYLLCKRSLHNARINPKSQRTHSKIAAAHISTTIDLCTPSTSHLDVVTSLWTNRLWHTIPQGHDTPGTRFSTFPVTHYSKKLYG